MSASSFRFLYPTVHFIQFTRPRGKRKRHRTLDAGLSVKSNQAAKFSFQALQFFAWHFVRIPFTGRYQKKTVAYYEHLLQTFQFLFILFWWPALMGFGLYW